MDNTKNNGNGHIKSANDFEGKEIEFPVTFQLKAVMTGTENDEGNKEKLEKVFANLQISFSYNDKKISSKGSYTSYTYVVTLNDRQQMLKLYDDLKSIKELKFAV